MLWKHWWELVCELRSACARKRTFLWMALCLAGMTVRKDLAGVTSIVRALGLKPACYDRLLDFFHSPALNLAKLTRRWCRLVFCVHPGVLRVNGRPVLVGDGIKVPKAGRKMPAIKKLHQPSESNTKPEYIFGHSCQAIALLTQALSSVLALPLACRIHEGVVFSNRDQRTLLDKMLLLIDSLGLTEPFYFVADAYYASGKIVRGLLAKGNHLITRVKSNSVAWFPAAQPAPRRRRRGRPRKYGKKIKVASLLQDANPFQEAASPVYGEEYVIIRFKVADLLWRPVGIQSPLRRRGSSAARHDPAHEYGSESVAPRNHPHLWTAVQNRSVLQAGPESDRRLCLSLLDGRHDPAATRQRKPISTPQNGKVPGRRTPKDRCLSSPHATRTHRPGPAADPGRSDSQPGLAIVRLLDPHRSRRIGPLRTGRRHGPAKYASRISHHCSQNRNPREIHPKPHRPV